MDGSLRVGLRGSAEDDACRANRRAPMVPDIRVMVAAIDTDPVRGGGTVVSGVVIEGNNIAGQL